MQAEGGKGAFKNPQGPAARKQGGALTTVQFASVGSREPEHPHWEQELEQEGGGGGSAGMGRKDQRKGRDAQEQVVKLPLQQRSQPPCARPSRFLPPADTLKAPTSQSQFEISTLAHQEAKGMGAFHPSELPALGVGLGGPYLEHMVAPGLFSPGVQADLVDFLLLRGRISGLGPEAKKCGAATRVWGCRGWVITVVKGATAPGAATATESATKDQTGPSF